MTASAPRAVFDCNVLLQAAVNGKGPAAACLELVEKGRARLFVSTSVIAELGDVLSRTRLAAKFRQLTDERVATFLSRVRLLSTSIHSPPHVFDLPRDAHDEPYLDLAVAAFAEYLVTRDNDLLDLMKSGDPIGQSFRARFPSLRVMDPVEFLRALNP